MEIPVVVSTDPDLLDWFNKSIVSGQQLTLIFKLVAVDGEALDPDSIQMYFWYQSRKDGMPFAKVVNTVDTILGTASIDIPPNVLNDEEGYDLELKFYPDDVQVYTIAKGRLQVLQGAEVPEVTLFPDVVPV